MVHHRFVGAEVADMVCSRVTAALRKQKFPGAGDNLGRRYPPANSHIP